MKTITFDEAYSLLSKSTAVLWTEYGFLTYPMLFDEENAEEGPDPFLELETTDEEGFVWNSKFNSEDNQTVKVEGSSKLILKDDTGEEVEVTLLVPAVI